MKKEIELPEWLIRKMKRDAHKYSEVFRDRKTVAPNPKLALAYEAGFKDASRIFIESVKIHKSLNDDSSLQD